MFLNGVLEHEMAGYRGLCRVGWMRWDANPDFRWQIRKSTGYTHQSGVTYNCACCARAVFQPLAPFPPIQEKFLNYSSPPLCPL